jgi:Verrucomicrobium spinosum paralogous protein TIGR02600
MFVPPSPRPRAFALVVVLFTVVFAALLVIGLFAFSQNRTRVSGLAAAIVDTQLAAETALHIVQTQIREATARTVSANGLGTEAWASQPGAIRTYSSSGELTGIYKLYSSETLQTTDPLFGGADVPDDWRSRPDAYVDLNEPVKRRDTWFYPIVSPESLTTVAGFSSSRARSPGVDWDDRLAMPVRWLYLSADGRVSADPSVGDPVARVAFWTDDESCKINVNTASATDENSYWDIPRATLRQDVRDMALRQPAQNEFNRYPGHPATVSLTTVFPDRNNEGDGWLQKLISATPRYKWGGSVNGTISIGSTRPPIVNDKTDRLYATMDEFLYAPNRATQLNLTEQQLDQSRFFLTASSRSSELNLFGQPRVTIWPVHAMDDPEHRTPFDSLIAFCSTIGAPGAERRFYFTRTDALSQTVDWTTQPDNQELFEYLRTLTSREIPGFGGNFAYKYDEADGGVDGERDQILTEIFDLIRCANLNETYSGVPPGYKGYTTMLRDAGGALSFTTSGADQSKFEGAGFVLPILTPYGRGAGRVPVISEVGLWFIQTVESGTTPVTEPKVEPGIIIETSTPMQGLMPWQPYRRSVEVAVSSQGPLPQVNGVPLPVGESPVSSYGPNSGIAVSQSLGGANGWAWLTADTNTFGRNPFLTRKSDGVPAPDGKIHITSGWLEIRLKCDGVVFQTCTVQIPDATLPVPDPVPAAPITTGNMAGREGWTERHKVQNYPPEFYPEDVVQSVMLRDGDIRVAACLQDIPGAFFSPHRNFGLQRFAHGFRTGFGVVDLGATNGSIVPVNYGTAPQSATLPSGRRNIVMLSAKPDIPDGITSLRDAGWEGDFDNGIGGVPDGAYMGKSDEGAYNWRVLNNEASEPPYFQRLWKLGDGLFSPLRQMPSPVVFGSLPTGVKRTVKAYVSGAPAEAAPWRTLVFCPNPSNPNHFGLSDPPDHLLLDLFTMPCVEPYAISEPFSMAGRLNMNCQIVPFTYIKRYTPMHAALAAQKIVAIPDSAAPIYKTTATQSANDALTTRLAVNIPETLEQWEEKFNKGEIFRSASEICEQFLVPVGATLDEVRSNWWNDYRLTGDNSRERPYATLYPLLTTRSSTFTMHYRAQAVKRLPNGTISVLAEKRGSHLFERHLDPNNPDIGKNRIDPMTKSLEPYFRFRTLLSKTFDP